MSRLLHACGLAVAATLCFGVSPTLHAQNFDSAGLQGASLNNPTSLQFGPDGRLYVSQQDGLIKALTVAKSGANYAVTATEDIAVVQQTQNHNDDGTVFNGQTKRQVTGLLVTGTANNVILYVTSSDYRIGGGGGGADLNLDTNSGTVHRLTKSSGTWQRLDLVRGLPRSEENHATNGMQVTPSGKTLYVAQGGHTNAGAPSNNFAFTTEYALAAALLTVDLDAIDALPTQTAADGSKYKYDLPTLDDPTRPNTGPGGADAGDPFGGNDGLNQAKLVLGGPVQVYASGFRNLYDVVLTQDGKLYGWDNGANGGWGGHPASEGVGSATNNWISGEPGSNGAGPNDAKVNNKDGLHFITGPGYYGGHPNPVRANPSGAGLFTQSGSGGGQSGVWRTTKSGANPLPTDWPPVPPSLANPIEGDFQNPGVDDASVFAINASTNGMCEYTSSANGGALRGDILAASFNGKIYRVQRNGDGTIDAANVSVLAEGFGATPLDVTAQGDGQLFAGTVWAATYGADAITVFTPTGGSGCDAPDSATVDTDGDGYANQDEYQNGTNPCSQSSVPADADGTLIAGFKVSDLNDPDDDDDGLPDDSDPFALDASNGLDTQLPLDLPLLNGTPGTGFFGLGLTGLMTNGQDYRQLIADETNSSTEIIAGGAVGLFTINGQGAGDAYNAVNSLKNGFQVGFPLSQNSGSVTLETKLLGPIWPGTPANYQQAGFALSDGTQANYLKIVPIAINGAKVQVQYQEADANVTGEVFEVAGLATASEIVLQLVVDPAAGTVQPKVKVGDQALRNLGAPIALRGTLLQRVRGPRAPAVTLVATSAIAGLTTNATWDYIRVTPAGGTPPTNPGTWTTVDGPGAGGCQPLGQSGSCARGRHEASYVQVGRKFYLLGGRENGSDVNVYDPAADTWTTGAAPGFPVHHFQAVAFDGLIYAIGVFEDNDFPTEQPYDKVLIYDPARDRWFDGPAIPGGRVRGSAGCVASGGKLYLVGGITDGHSSGWSNQLDRYDPVTGQWTTLANLPRARDHFHAGVKGGKIYVAGGRRSGQNSVFAPTISQVDVYDISTNAWSTWANNLPTQRAAAAVAVLGDELLVIGGERDAGAANDEVEALDLNTRTWRTLSPLNQGRHGTQAIVNNGAVYVASGSPNRGGGNTRTQERFTLGAGAPVVTGEVLAKAQLSAPSGKTYNDVALGASANENVALRHTGGNQGAVIESVSVSGAGFSIVGGAGQWTGRLIRPGATQNIVVEYARQGSAAASGQLRVVTSASAPAIVINLSAPAIGGGGTGGQTLYLNAAGPAVTAGGQAYSADQYFSAGTTASSSGAGVPVAGTNADAVYQSHRWAPNDFAYDIPLPDGAYRVTLKFAETYFVTTGGGGPGTGKRIFSVDVEGQRVLSDFDINAAAGGNTPKAVDRGFDVTVTGGNLDIDFVKGAANNPMVSAIIVAPATGTPAAPQLSLAPGSVAFQTQDVNTISPAVTVRANNTGTAVADVASVQISGPQASAFAKTGINADTDIAAGGLKNFQVTFSPNSEQPAVQTATLTIDYSGGRSVALSLTGEARQSGTGGTGGGGSGSGDGPDLELSAAAGKPNPAQWTVGDGRFTLRNAGTATATGVKVKLLLPSDMVFQGGNEATTSKGSFDPYTSQVWNVGNLAAGATATIDYRVFNKSASAQRVRAFVTAQGGGADQDSSPSNAPDGEDDSACFEFNGAGNCGGASGGGGGGGTTAGIVPDGFRGEAGSLTVTQADDQQWTRINFAQSYTNPIVVAHLATANGGQPAHARLRAVTSTSAEVQVEEWDYLDGGHVAERIDYVVVEAGRYDFDDGRVWTAGRQDVAGWTGVPGEPSGTYAALATVATARDTRACVVRQRRSGGNVEFQLQTEEAIANDHAAEQVHYLLVSQGTGQLDGRAWRSVLGADELTADLRAYAYAGPFGDDPVLLANIQTFDGGDAAGLRTVAPSTSGFTAFVEEEQSRDVELGHTPERLGYFATAPGVWSAGTTAKLQAAGFEAAPDAHRVKTYWPLRRADLDASASATRLSGYTIERRVPGGAWMPLADVPAAAVPAGAIGTYWDEAPALGESHYRLRTRLSDGTYRLSPERAVAFAIDATAVRLYPNPATFAYTLYVPRATAHPLDVRIVNSLGQTLRQRRSDDPAEEFLDFDVDLPAGTYHVEVRVGGFRRVLSLVIAE